MPGSRRSVAPLVVAAPTGAAGFASWLWATNRDYADNQRNWGYLLGALGLGAGFLIALFTLLLDVWRGRHNRRS